MSNFGVQRLRVVNPYEVAFREARSAVGASGLLAKAEQYDGVAEAVADCKLVVGTTVAGPVGTCNIGCFGWMTAPSDQTATEDGARSLALRLGKIWPIKSGDEPLPLGDADSDARRARLDESGAGRRGLLVRTGARTEGIAGKSHVPKKRRRRPQPRENWSG